MGDAFLLVLKIDKTPETMLRGFVESGRSGGTRTPSPRFWRPVLYQLSYTPKGALLNDA